ncbi:MAG: hypothetical protein Q9195_008269 [Heterodermia aff. obscurata]
MQSPEKESDSECIQRPSSRIRNDLQTVRPRQTRRKQRRNVIQSSSDDSSVDSGEDNAGKYATNIEPASRTTYSSERSSLNPARQLRSSESSIPEAGPCEPCETIRIAKSEQLPVPDSRVKTEPQADATPIAKLAPQIKKHKRRRNEVDILFTTRGNSDAELRVPSAYQIEAEIDGQPKRVKIEESSRSRPLMEGTKTPDRIDKQRPLESHPGKERKRLVAVPRKHGPSRWRQRVNNPLFRTPDPEENSEGSGQRPPASVEYPRRKAQYLPRRRSERKRTLSALAVSRAQYQDLTTRNSLGRINRDSDSSEDDDDFLDDDSEQSSEFEESSDSTDQYREDSEPDGLARSNRGQSSPNIKQPKRPSATQILASQRSNSSLPVPNQETPTNSTCDSSSWKLASRQAKSQNPLEKCYRHFRTIFQRRDLAIEHAEPGKAVKALELAASIFEYMPFNNTDATLLLAVEAEIDRRLAPQKHIAIAETMHSKGAGQKFSPAFIEQELRRLKKEQSSSSCCASTRTATHQAHRLEIESLETTHAAEIAHLVASHKAQMIKILDTIRHEAQKINHESTKSNISQDESANKSPCKSCKQAHKKCAKDAEEAAECSRCVLHGIECVYGV